MSRYRFTIGDPAQQPHPVLSGADAAVAIRAIAPHYTDATIAMLLSVAVQVFPHAAPVFSADHLYVRAVRT